MKSYFFVIFFILSSCTHTADTNTENLSHIKCDIRSTKIYKGQIRYSEKMNLKIPDCEIYYSSDFEFKTEQAIGKVIDQIDTGVRKTPQYIDITFRGYMNWRGKLVIKNVDLAKVSDSVIF